MQTFLQNREVIQMAQLQAEVRHRASAQGISHHFGNQLGVGGSWAHRLGGLPVSLSAWMKPLLQCLIPGFSPPWPGISTSSRPVRTWAAQQR